MSFDNASSIYLPSHGFFHPLCLHNISPQVIYITLFFYLVYSVAISTEYDLIMFLNYPLRNSQLNLPDDLNIKTQDTGVTENPAN